MTPINAEKLEKLETRMLNMVRCLVHHNQLHIHQAINQFYYMQKAEELRIMRERLLKAQEEFDTLTGHIQDRYTEVFCKWRTDMQWLNSHGNLNKDSMQIDPCETGLPLE